jgi:hypothetical protein
VESGGGPYIRRSLGDGLAHGASETWFSGFGRKEELKNFLLPLNGSTSLRASIKSLVCRFGKLFLLFLSVFCGSESFGIWNVRKLGWFG